MDFIASRLLKEMEVQQKEKAMMHQSPFVMVNSISSPMYGAPWAPMPAPVFPSGSRFGGATSGLRGGRHGGIEMKLMFSKRLTPSDVGKLNRLLIPRREAKRSSPMALGAMDGDRSSVLSFEDSTGVIWHFRYNFWQSSKTYVLTKGWIRFVKEKKLNYGDTVSFYHGACETSGINRRFIYFKKQDHGSSMPHHVPPATVTPFGTLDDEWLLKAFRSSGYYTANQVRKPVSHGSKQATPPNLPILSSTQVPQGPSLGCGVRPTKKRVRLFGVDLNIPPQTTSDDSFPWHVGSNNGGA